MTTANKITIVRILMIPCFVMMAIYYGRGVSKGHPQDWQRYVAIAIFLLAAASDGLDGYVARRYHQKSQLGVILDPIADKGLLLAAILTLSFSNWAYEFPIWFPVLVITRDVVILTGTLMLHYLVGKVHVRPSWVGKVATVLQMAAVSLALLQLNFFAWMIPLGSSGLHVDFLDIPVVLAGIFTLISGIGYVMEGIRQLQAGGHANAGP
ncbi:MAG: CDP-diacylglycerol--glycerol-3-phosphate 3-phosphatidyltransferase [Verrucomicrobiota bacterium]|nr:CDP-diacylglycerol--glycerol-3-phosphate 3-phosphatidyltransferase [Verrucomicrobiota bacterium]